MPPLKIAHVISFSSEDKVHAAKNIIDANIARKWKCASPGEKCAILFLQLEKASVISGIDIGNEYSAYIEVFVSRSAEASSDYRTFLAMSTFMSANESKNGININRVRMFKMEDFSKPENNEKWDRVKIVCSQPYNKYVQYGLSFIRFNTYETDTSFNSEKNYKKLGKFTLRPESPIDLTGYAWIIQKKDQIEKSKTVAQSIRAATSPLLNDQDVSVISSPRLLPLSLKNSASKKKKNDSLNTDDIIMKNRNRAELFHTKDEIKPHSKIDKLIEQKQAEQEKMNEKATKQSTKKEKNKEKNDEEDHKKRRRIEEDSQSSSKRKKNSSKNAPKKESSHKKAKATTITKSFNKLLEDVVIVISGIQNPARANLKAKIIEMGGKYKSDWDNTCTHLICAFMNTPKFNQVKGKGKIVTSKWIEECYSERKKIPWRRHALEKQEKSQNESEDEILEKTDEIKKMLSPKIDIDEDDYEETMEQASDTEDKIEKIKNTKNYTSKTEYKMEVQDAPHSSLTNDSDSSETEGETERKKQLNDNHTIFSRQQNSF